MGRLIFFLVVGVLFYLIYTRSKSGSSYDRNKSELLRLCDGDAARMERLIAAEQARKPGLPRDAAIDNAIERLRPIND